MSLAKRLTLGLGTIALGLCAALLYRRPASPELDVITDTAANQLSLGEGVSLQMPGQTMSGSLKPTPPEPWTAESDEPGGAPSPTTLALDTESAEPTLPPALPDQYRPLFKPAAATDNSGHVVPPAGPPPLPRRPVKKHTIHDGDTLESLAARYLGDATRAAEILQANRDILSDPQLLPIGVAIVIPPDTTPGAVDPARSTAADTPLPLVPLPTDGFRRGR